VVLWKRILLTLVCFFDGEMSDNQKILGVSWNSVSDTLIFDIKATVNALQTLKPTKRNVVGFSSRFYDPLGFLSPVILTLKVLSVTM